MLIKEIPERNAIIRNEKDKEKINKRSKIRGQRIRKENKDYDKKCKREDKDKDKKKKIKNENKIHIRRK